MTQNQDFHQPTTILLFTPPVYLCGFHPFSMSRNFLIINLKQRKAEHLSLEPSVSAGASDGFIWVLTPHLEPPLRLPPAAAFWAEALSF